MKKNLILFFIFITLLVGTYFVQEKRVDEEYQDAITRDRVVTFEINQLKMGEVEAKKVKGQWWEGKTLLSHNTFNQVEKKLLEIKKIKDITGEWKSFFSHPFTFEINHTVWTIGDLSLDRQGFYVAQDKKIMLVVIEGESTELTQNENDIASIKLDELKKHLSKTRDELKEHQFFRFYPDLPYRKVMVESEGRLTFELDFEKNTTNPPPIPGIYVHDKIVNKFHSLITQMNMKEEIPYSEKLKFKKMASITFLAKSKVVWELWIKSDKSADAILIDPDQKRAFLMVGGTLKSFFILIQDYWDKKVIPASEFKPFSRLPMTFSQGSKQAEVFVLNQEPMKFDSPKHKVQSENLYSLIQLVFNLSQHDQADRVSILSKTEKQQLMSGEFLRLHVLNQDLIFWPKAEELIVVNLTQGFKAHFGMYQEKWGARFEDVIK